jgi:phospholipid/cholesterol/gamma-HCH transport system substrate-binding protein
MKPIVRDFVVGLTVLSGLTVLILGMIFFGKFTFESEYRFKMRLATASGLAKASRVTYNGVSVGSVDTAEILPPEVGGVELTLKLRSSAAIPRKANVAIDKGLIGDASLDFVVPKGLSASELADVLKPGDVFEGGSPASLFDKLVKSLDEPLAKLAKTTDRIDHLADVYAKVGEKLDDALEPRSLADVKAGKAPNLRSLLERIQTTLDNADQIIGDGELKNQVKSIMAKADATMTDAKELASSLRKTAGKVDSAVDSADATIKRVDGATQTVQEKLVKISDAASETLSKAQAAADKLATALDTATSGKGSLGQLMNNPDLYNSLKDAAARLDKALAEVQTLAEKFRTEGVKLRL